MALFDGPHREVQSLLAQWEHEKRLRHLEPLANWPTHSELVLQEETRLGLGNPGLGSLSMFLWTEEPLDDAAFVLGPELADITEAETPFAQVLIASGNFKNPYDDLIAIRDAIYRTHLSGFMTRTLPSRNILWCRVSGKALDRGFSLAHLAGTLIENVKAVDTVNNAQLLFVTGNTDAINALKPAAEQARQIIGATIRISEEPHGKCEKCEYWDVCKSIDELRRLRERNSGATP
jgi:CO dehydrogenase/acetyl-CoA synthase beta subunit